MSGVTDLTGKVANRPVQKHEEETLVTGLAKTSLRLPNASRHKGSDKRPIDRTRLGWA